MPVLSCFLVVERRGGSRNECTRTLYTHNCTCAQSWCHHAAYTRRADKPDRSMAGGTRASCSKSRDQHKTCNRRSRHRDHFTEKPERPKPQSQSLFRSYGSILPTSLTYIRLLTRGCSPWRPDAVSGTDECQHCHCPRSVFQGSIMTLETA